MQAVHPCRRTVLICTEHLFLGASRAGSKLVHGDCLVRSAENDDFIFGVKMTPRTSWRRSARVFGFTHTNA